MERKVQERVRAPSVYLCMQLYDVGTSSSDVLKHAVLAIGLLQLERRESHGLMPLAMKQRRQQMQTKVPLRCWRTGVV